ncbi:MAG TPA: hypothetical protein VJT49_09120 [Amycolatopsis sp.]|uniref:hypothetical protein n=1 Tax=Amycolatopsis sp. TaxID=37632 RepID=UPI002B490E3A|nr:hypothetical protein [Amycolatopsis sp.]HKS45262.1 hypothetical protein [Amycolatopsis sp.]
MTGVRHTAWFPPALLGFLLIGLLGWKLSRASGWFAFTPGSDRIPAGVPLRVRRTSAGGAITRAVRVARRVTGRSRWWFLATIAW